jgi:hypothetical protein
MAFKNVNIYIYRERERERERERMFRIFEVFFFYFGE